jgi:hypothetical protein
MPYGMTAPSGLRSGVLTHGTVYHFIVIAVRDEFLAYLICGIVRVRSEDRITVLDSSVLPGDALHPEVHRLE